MDSSITTDIAQLSEIPKSKGFLFFWGKYLNTNHHADCVYTLCQYSHSTIAPDWDVQPEVWLSQITRSMKTQLQGHFLPRIVGAVLAHIGFVSSFP